MKKVIVICFLLFLAASSFAADYYVANNGNDDDSPVTGNPDYGRYSATPWQTIEKVNSSFFQPDDTIHFKCGDEWREQLHVPSSGAVDNPITFTSYGDCTSDPKPVINAADVINSGWSQYPGNINIYVADVDLRTNPLNLVVNNTFDADVNEWRAWPDYGNPDDAAKEFISDCDLNIEGSSGGCLKYTSSPTRDGSQLQAQEFSVKQGVEYSIRFSLSADENIQVTVRVMQSPFGPTDRAYDEPIMAGSFLSDHSDTFIPSMDMDNVKLFFYPPTGQKVIYVDDVSVKAMSDEPSVPKQLFVNGSYMELAQYPNDDPTDYSFDYLIIDEDTVYDHEVCQLHKDGIPEASSLIDYDLDIPAQDLIGAGIHIRSVTGMIEDRTVDAFDINTHELTWINENKKSTSYDNDTSCAINEGEGYYLSNQLWMLDQAGEWFYDESNKKLYVWLPDSSNPSSHLMEASNYNQGIKVSGRNYIVLDNLKISHAAEDGLAFLNSPGFIVSNTAVSD